MDTPRATDEAERPAARRPRVLMTLADVAWPLDAGMRLRSAGLVRAVARTCDVDAVVLFADCDPKARPLPPDVEGSWQVIEALLRPMPRTGLYLLRHLVPWQIAVHDWDEVRRRLARYDTDYDVIWFGALDHYDRLAGDLHGRRVVVDCDDVETDKMRRFIALGRRGGLSWADLIQRRVELPMWARVQRKVMQGADGVLVCSELDRHRLAAEAAPEDPRAVGRIVNVPNSYPEPEDRQPRDPQGDCTLVVVANYGTDQNLDAAAFVATELMAPLRAAIPGARVRLVGRRVDRLAAFTDIEGLDIVGPVDSVATELARAHAVLVPIRYGGGTRLKVVEALAYGVPVVSTSAGAEGIDAVDGEEILIGDDPAALVAAVLRLLSTEGLAERLATGGRRLYEREYSPSASDDAVEGLLARLGVIEAAAP